MLCALKRFKKMHPNLSLHILGDTIWWNIQKMTKGDKYVEFKLDFFANDAYDILKLLHDNQIKVKEAVYVPLSQQELADMAHFSKLKTNKLLNALIEAGYVVCFEGRRGKYAITDKGYKVIALMQQVNS